MHLNVKGISQGRPNREKYLFNELVLGKRKPPVLAQRVNQTDTVLHTHDFSELVFILNGSASHEVGKKTYDLKPGDFFLIDSRMKHAYRNCRLIKLVNVLIQKKFIERRRKVLSSIKGSEVLFSYGRSGNFIHPPNLGPERLGKCLSIVNKIEREQFESGPASDEMLADLLSELLITSCRFAEREDNRSSTLWPRMEKVLSHIQSSYQEEINLEKLCAMACMSKRSFLRHFMKTTGFSPIQYLLSIRISKACQLLRESDLPLCEVSYSCGFEDSNYFSRIFKKTTDLSPKEFRRKISVEI